ncbi:UNVERIFIED_CONTAM: hypothetical protein Scaly_2502800 [Sesamum calycinum]|uniref:Retrotransposon gag domain-containing protein n=1 Tax=Sesamum calycinum TaxID=2727403 RepID=A0AAW2LSA9_9LAMI
METPTNAANKQKARETPVVTTQALQVISSTPFTPISRSTMTTTTRSTDPATNTPRIIISPDAPPVELSSDLLRTIQKIIASAIHEQLAVLILARVTTPLEVTAPKQTDPVLVIPRPNIAEGPSTQLPTQVEDVPPQWLARLEYLQKGLQDVQYKVMGAQAEEQAIPFIEGVMADELPMNYRTLATAEYDGTTDPQEHLSRLKNAAWLHRYTDGIKCPVFVTTFARAAHSLVAGNTEVSLFSICQKEGELLKEYLQRFNTAALEVPSATQEVKASAFAQRLLDGYFFKSLAKSPTIKFDALLAWAAKYISREEAQASKREGRGEKRKENKDEGPSKNPKTHFKDKKPAWQRVNSMYTPLAIPITQALMAVEGKG